MHPERQAAAYEQFFDENTLVVGGRYLHTAQEKVPESWGILCIERHGILKVRAAAKNKKFPSRRSSPFYGGWS